MLEQQVQQGHDNVGVSLKNDEIDALSAEQLGQLHVLKEEASKLH